jgi:hypothetical protein
MKRTNGSNEKTCGEIKKKQKTFGLRDCSRRARLNVATTNNNNNNEKQQRKTKQSSSIKNNLRLIYWIKRNASENGNFT